MKRYPKIRNPIRTLSLFSGAGGLDIGFAQAGFDIVACVEVEQKYCKSLEANRAQLGSEHGPADIYCKDIRDFDARPFKGLGIECVIGGPPCQTFSAAGRRAGGVIGTEDHRGQLFQSYCRILQELRPKVFVFENVYGLPGANGGGPWKEIISAFSALGYNLRAEVVDAADYGAPQHRERLVMVGFREGEFVFPLPTHGPDSGTDQKLVSVEEAIRDLQAPSEPFHDSLGGLYGHLLPLVPEGLNYSYFTAEMGHPEPVFAWRSKFHDLLYKVSRNEPCRTIKAQPGKFTGPFHWKNRHFTVHELKRLQTFPDNYELIGSFGQIVEQIGNSVPPRLAKAIACSVRDQLVRPARIFEYSIRPTEFKSTFRQRQRARTHTFDGIAARAIAAQYPKTSKKLGLKKTRDNNIRYFIKANSLFDRTLLRTANGANYEVRIKDIGSKIDIKFDSIAGDPRDFAIQVGGLRKYLPEFDSLNVTGTMSTLEDMFHMWSAVEEALIKRSRFFSLIDIYGHYANRGDTVKISGTIDLAEPYHIVRMVNWMLLSENCGDFVSEEQFCMAVKTRPSWLPKSVTRLRQARFDIRTSETHPIIGANRMICTYPFPLLSPRALVESRAVFSTRESAEDLLKRVG